ncbi:MAG: gliding motility-associated C-terminal domain-containing protein [Bacteroidales bacterium]|nr:gliding motility-associated C-terminal domain-containing protein [Bacteroidales bacterium]
MFKRLFIVVLLSVQLAVSAQTILMPVNGHGDTTMSYVELYDDGGGSSPHSQSCNATYTFHTVSPQGRYIIQVNSSLTHPSGNASLQVFNGTSATGTPIFTSPFVSYGTYHSNTNAVTVKFLSDDNYPTDGFEIILCEYDNAVPVNLTTDFIDSNTIYITWTEQDTSTIWIFDYAIVDTTINPNFFFADSSNFTTILLDTSYMEFYNVPVGSYLVYRIYTISNGPCTRVVAGTGNGFSQPPECPCVKPLNIDITSLDDSIRVSWTSDTISHGWHIIVMGYGIDTILPPDVMVFTFAYDYPCSGAVLFIGDSCLSLCNTVFIDLPLGGCHETVGGFRRVSTTGSTITLAWNDAQDTAARYLLYMRRVGEPVSSEILLDTLNYGTTSYTVTSLQPHTAYIFSIHVICASGVLACFRSQITVSTTLDNCIDFINLFDSDNIHLTCGSYSNPSLNVVSSSGRHVVVLDTGQYDPNTGNALRCIPEGEGASFRLGDDNIGAQGETVTYDYVVDSLDKDMLVLKYAVVLQNPNHTSANQPHFSMEILDAAGQIIDTHCCYADFFAAGDMGWNSVDGTDIIWKDWTTVGVDITPYHGQNIKIRFTTTDCAEGGHFGYAYFTIHCDSKRIALVNLCETTDSVRLRAPEGFEYRWTHGSDTTVISTLNEIVVPADTTEYFCHASFIGKPDCSFMVHSFAVLPVPRASMQYAIDTCGLMIHLYNRSFVDIDSDYLQYVRQTIDSVVWVIDGITLDVGNVDTVSIPITGNGTVSAGLFCMLSGSDCLDSTAMVFDVNFYHEEYILGDTVSCYGDTVTLIARLRPYDGFSFLWDDDSYDTIRRAMVTSDTIFKLMYKYYSCRDTISFPIAVYQGYDDTVVVESCGPGDTLGFHFSRTGVFSWMHQDRHGCDSLTTLDVTVFPTYADTVSVVTCDESYSDSEFDVDSTGFYIHAYTSQHGCDSIMNLAFLRHTLFEDSIKAEILYGDIYDRYGFYETETGEYTKLYVDRYGCDSVYWLDLHVVKLGFPNAVSPNGDGINDFFGIAGLVDASIFDQSALWIYDRWGRKIFHKEDIKNERDFWNPDKTHSPDGTYYFIFRARVGVRTLEHKGVVEVVR